MLSLQHPRMGTCGCELLGGLTATSGENISSGRHEWFLQGTRQIRGTGPQRPQVDSIDQTCISYSHGLAAPFVLTPLSPLSAITALQRPTIIAGIAATAKGPPALLPFQMDDTLLQLRGGLQRAILRGRKTLQYEEGGSHRAASNSFCTAQQTVASSGAHCSEGERSVPAACVRACWEAEGCRHCRQGRQ